MTASTPATRVNRTKHRARHVAVALVGVLAAAGLGGTALSAVSTALEPAVSASVVSSAAPAPATATENQAKLARPSAEMERVGKIMREHDAHRQLVNMGAYRINYKVNYQW